MSEKIPTTYIEDLSILESMFPNINPWGSYDTLSMTPLVNKFTAEETLKEINDFKLETIYNTHRLILHEVNHWYQNNTTVWGQKYTLKWINCIHLRRRNVYREFYQIAEFAKYTRFLQLIDYYTYVLKKEYDHSRQQKWYLKIDLGERFDCEGKITYKYPQLFVHFANEREEEICRIPLSVATLLEAEAKYSEYELIDWAISTFSDKEDSSNTIKLLEIFSEEQHISMYHPDYVKYSTATHIVANRFDLTSLREASIITHLLVRISLNLPGFLYKDIKVPKDLIPSPIAVASFIELEDPVYVFYSLVFSSEGKDVKDLKELIELILKSANLPKLSKLNKLVMDEMEKLTDQIIEGPEEKIVSRFLEVGRYNYEKVGILGSPLISEFYGTKEVILPWIYCKDGNSIYLSKEQSEELSTQTDFLLRRIAYQNIINEFLYACCISPL